MEAPKKGRTVMPDRRSRKRVYHPSVITKAFFIFIGLLFPAMFYVFINLVTPVSSEENWKEIVIPEGSSYSKGINILKEHGIIKNRFIFLMLGKVTKTETQLRAGYYNLSPSMTPLDIFDNLIKGKTIQYIVTIPEGSTLLDIRGRLEDVGLVDGDSWKFVYDSDFLSSLNVDSPSLEGYLFPDTYNFQKGVDPRVVFKVMVQRLRDVLDESMRARAREIGMSENDVVTLASIIEKEAVHDSERPVISAVYHNRLKKKMKLQADPTVLYGVGKKWGRIGYRDLLRQTPYNTYKIQGLPPGPIASPGLKSIKAALYPADVDYLFFVSMNNGRHHFSLTGREHVAAVELYRLKSDINASDETDKTDKTD